MAEKVAPLTWLDKPYVGDKMYTYTDAQGQEHALPHKYPGVSYRQVVDAQEIRPGLFYSLFLIDDFHFCNRIDHYTLADPGQSALFVDCGHYDVCGVDFLDRTLEKAQVEWPQAQVLVTHLHDDHNGNVPYCLDQGARSVYRGPKQLPVADMVEHFLVAASVPAEDRQAYSDYINLYLAENDLSRWGQDVSRELHTGDVLQAGDYHLEVMETPGHASEHIVLIEPEQRFMFAGDHVADASPGHIQLLPDQHLVKKFLDSFDTLRGYHLDTVYMSHHEELRGQDEINAFYDKIMRSYDKPIAQYTQILRENGPLSVYEAAALSAAHRPGGMQAQPTLQRMRRSGIAHGFLEYLADIGVATRHTNDDGSLVFEAVK